MIPQSPIGMPLDDFLANTVRGRAASAEARAPANSAKLREDQEHIRNALGKAPQIAALEMCLASERPSYFPGQDFATAAYNEGRKSVLRDLIAFLKKDAT